MKFKIKSYRGKMYINNIFRKWLNFLKKSLLYYLINNSHIKENLDVYTVQLTYNEFRNLILRGNWKYLIGTMLSIWVHDLLLTSKLWLKRVIFLCLLKLWIPIDFHLSTSEKLVIFFISFHSVTKFYLTMLKYKILAKACLIIKKT